jgi:U3 small nucleolar RNA-associated protein 16
MVTTRRQSGNNATLGGGDESLENVDLPKELQSPASRKRRRAQAADVVMEEKLSTPSSASKRQKKLPVRSKDGESVEKQTKFSSEIPISEAKGGKSAKNTPVKKGKAGAKAVPVHDEEDVVEEEATNIPQSTKSPRSKKINNAPIANPAKIETPAKSSAKPKHKRFGSEDPVEPVVLGTAPAPEVEDSEEESSDDDAPEVIGAQDAEEKVRAAAQEAAKAAEQ